MQRKPHYLNMWFCLNTMHIFNTPNSLYPRKNLLPLLSSPILCFFCVLTYLHQFSIHPPTFRPITYHRRPTADLLYSCCSNFFCIASTLKPIATFRDSSLCWLIARNSSLSAQSLLSVHYHRHCWWPNIVLAWARVNVPIISMISSSSGGGSRPLTIRSCRQCRDVEVAGPTRRDGDRVTLHRG